MINALTKCSIKQAEVIEGLGLPKIISTALANDNAMVVLYGLDCLEKLLEKGKIIQDEEAQDQNPFLYNLQSEGTLTKLEALQYHKNENVYKKVSEIIDKFLEYNQE